VAGARNARIRTAGVVAALLGALPGAVLTGCTGDSPSTGATVPTPAPTETSAAATPEPSTPQQIPTVTAQPLSPETTPAPTSAQATTAPPGANPTPPASADPGSTAGACERTMPAYPMLVPGARGPAVRALQCFLNDADYGPVAVNGTYGAQTRAAVKHVEDTLDGAPARPGRIDDGMWVLVISRSMGLEPLRLGSSGPEVVTLQRALRAAGATLPVDGHFGARTQAAVRAFQEANSITVDGVVGDETHAFLKSGAVIGSPS
jgi:peptidoglycan hydrolase-like protein with peptidoglycan-binding domain